MLRPHKKLNRKQLIGLLNDKINSIDVASARREVQPFLRDLDSVKMWSKDFFREIINRIHLI